MSERPTSRATRSLLHTFLGLSLLLVSTSSFAWTANLTATPNPNAGTYTLSWNGVGSGLYKLYERPAGTSGGTQIWMGNGGGTHNISGQASGNYEYWLTRRYAVCSGGGRGGCNYYTESSETIVVTVDLSPPIPSGLTGPATDPDGSYTISWNSSTGATSYKLEQRLNGGAWTNIYSGSATSKAISGNGNGTWTYRVQACNGPTDCSAWSSTHTTTVEAPPAAPTGVTGPATDPDGNYTISWNVSSGATSYTLEEQTNGGSWSSIYSGATNSAAIAGRADASYTYRIKACNSLSYCSGWSSTHTVVVSTPPPSATVDYQYDALGRLIEVSDSINGSIEYDYDSAGNRTQVSETAANQ